MNRLTRLLYSLPAYVPEPVKPVLRPLQSTYQSVVQTVAARQGKIVRRTPWGPAIVSDPADVVERSLVTGRFEPAVIDHFRSVVDEQSPRQFADVGAYIGFYSLLFRYDVGPESRIDAFEPHGPNCKRLRRNFEVNDYDLPTVHEFAVSDSSGSVEMALSTLTPAESSVTGSTFSGDTGRSVAVDAEPLDVVYTDTVPDLVKIDVEGAEGQVLAGGREALSETPDLLLELHPTLLPDLDTTVSDVVAELDTLGYSTALHVEEGRRLSLAELTRFEGGSTVHLHVR